MRGYSALVAFATTVSTATAVIYQGFNYGSDQMDQTSFETAFKAAQALSGAPGGGFTSARLYTMIQSGTPDTPISAIPAAIETKTSLLLGLWISADMTPELSALTKAISQYGNDLAKLVVGISVGSEDLYRITQIAHDNKETVAGASPDYVVQCINQVRNAVKGTALAGTPIGHVDTWNSWDNSSNKMVIDNSDWLGTDAYPYWEATYENTIENSKNLFFDALSKTNAAAKGKPVWITETGFPVSGKASNKATPSVENARKYWKDVGCGLFGTYSTWWFQLSGLSDHGTLDFGLMKDLSASPYFDLSCPPAASTNVDPSSTAAQSTKPPPSPSPSSSTVSKPSPTSTSTPSAISSSSISPATTVSSPQSLATSTTVAAIKPSDSGSSFVCGGVGSTSSSAASIPSPSSISSTSGTTSSPSPPSTTSASSCSHASTSGNLTVNTPRSVPSANNTVPTTSAPPTSSTPPTITNPNGASAISGSIGAAFAAVMVAILAL